jgi:TRAP-type uncharacterized transport system fused permease subunit
MAVYDPALMMQPVAGLSGADFWVNVAYMVVKAGLAVLLWGAASVGYLNAKMPWWERLGAAIAAAFLVLALPVTDEVGFALAALVLGFHFWRARRTASTMASRS